MSGGSSNMICNNGEVLVTCCDKILCDGISITWDYSNKEALDHVSGTLHVGDVRSNLPARLFLTKITDQIDIWIIMTDDNNQILYRKICEARFTGESGSFNTYGLLYDNCLVFKARTISDLTNMSKEAYELLLKRFGEL